MKRQQAERFSKIKTTQALGVTDKDVKSQSLPQYHVCCGEVGVLQGICLNKSKYPPVNISGKLRMTYKWVYVWILPLVMQRACLSSAVQVVAKGNIGLESLNILTLL